MLIQNMGNRCSRFSRCNTLGPSIKTNYKTKIKPDSAMMLYELLTSIG
jgi:hypothetical protein